MSTAFALAALRPLLSGAVQHVLPRLMDPYIRSKTLQQLERLLQSSARTPQQATYLYNLFKDEALLQRVSTLRDAQGVHAVVTEVIGPPQSTGPRSEEALIVTHALLAALLNVTAPNAHAGLTSSMLLGLHLEQQLPAFSTLVSDHRRRTADPAGMAAADLAGLLRQANQTTARITVDADGGLRLVGTPRLTFTAGGGNSARLRAWIDSGMASQIVLTSADGPLGVSYGLPDLDRLLLPGDGQPVELHLSPAPRRFGGRVRVSAPDQPPRFLAVELTYTPDQDALSVTFGPAQFRLQVDLRRTGAETAVKMRLGIDLGDRPLDEMHRTLLQALTLMTSPDMRVELLKGSLRPESGGAQGPEEDVPLFDGAIWGADGQNGEFAERLAHVLRVHLMYLDIVKYVTEQGHDPDGLRLLEQLDQGSVDVLERISAAITRPSERPAVGLQFQVSPDLADLLDAGQPCLVKHTVQLDLGSLVIEVESRIDDLTVLQTERGPQVVDVQAEGVISDQQIAFQPAGSIRTPGASS